MKKVNKVRKITENDIRNLHYIHENEGLIPDGVTKLEDEDITSAEVITESKKSKVNESEDDEYTREDYENDLGGYLISLPYEKVKAYKKINTKLTNEEIEKLQQKFTKLEHDSVDLDDKLADGEITEEDYENSRGNLIKKSLKVFRKLTGGCDPDWYDPDEMGDFDPDLGGKVNESNNIAFWVSKRNPGNVKDEANNVLRMLGYRIDPSQTELEEIIKHFHEDYNGDKDYEEYTVMLLGYYYLMFGYTEFYNNYASKYDVAVDEYGVLTGVNEDDNEDADIVEFRKLINSDVWKKFKEDWKGTDVYDVAIDAISYVETLPQMINMLKRVLTEYDMLIDYETELDKLLKQQSVNEGRLEDFMNINSINPNIVDDKEAFEDKIQHFINCDGDYEFHEDILLMLNAYKKKYGETDFYHNLANQGYSLDDLKHEGRLRFFCQKYLKKNGFDVSVLNNQSSLKDSIQNMDNNNKDYTQICALLNYYKEHYGMDDFVRSLTDENNNDPFGDAHYYDIDSYGKFETINEYKTVGVYKTNDGDVEDLYYIQAGDIILINHKDYGELQCKVKKVDADKNKVYFVTIERGIMGVCGFDKIHGIELVDECQKQPVFVQTKYITFPEGGMCYMCYSKVGNRFIDVYCTFGMSLDNCECIKLLNMTEDEFGIIDNIMAESDIFEEAKTKVYNSGLMSL